ncbi:MAG: SDR family NAD(P)-dependent oxidoreductase [Chitinivibrionales bacterium]|nr:SDR family NAD(P)-dependent oxidoreductase [Chitinivibrionales bacterium]
MSKWTHKDMPDCMDKKAVVTGANSGLGFYTARALVQKGAEVILACRNLHKAIEAREEIETTCEGCITSVMQLDLSSLASVRKFSEEYAKRYDRLDILINNAGVMAPPYAKTEDGFELQFGTNHLGHFALTGLLINLLLPSRGSRIVTVSSGAHYIGAMDFDTLNWEKNYARWPAYGRSKLANLLFTYELQRKLDRANAGTIAAAAHPGWAATNLQRESLFFRTFNPLFGQKPGQGAWPILYAATAHDVQGGDFFGPGSFFGLRGHPKKTRSSERSYDQTTAGRLWEISEKLTGVHYSL